MMTVWDKNDKIFFYFDESNMFIYPDERAGFDKVFARIHIRNELDRSQVPHDGVVTR